MGRGRVRVRRLRYQCKVLQKSPRWDWSDIACLPTRFAFRAMVVLSENLYSGAVCRKLFHGLLLVLRCGSLRAIMVVLCVWGFLLVCTCLYCVHPLISAGRWASTVLRLPCCLRKPRPQQVIKSPLGLLSDLCLGRPFARSSRLSIRYC